MVIDYQSYVKNDFQNFDDANKRHRISNRLTKG